VLLGQRVQVACGQLHQRGHRWGHLEHELELQLDLQLQLQLVDQLERQQLGVGRRRIGRIELQHGVGRRREQLERQ
jgi:hypothetical protein